MPRGIEVSSDGVAESESCWHCSGPVHGEEDAMQATAIPVHSETPLAVPVERTTNDITKYLY
jgi:hypothetical protein